MSNFYEFALLDEPRHVREFSYDKKLDYCRVRNAKGLFATANDGFVVLSQSKDELILRLLGFSKEYKVNPQQCFDFLYRNSYNLEPFTVGFEERDRAIDRTKKLYASLGIRYPTD